eukprot:CAMPEP_0172897676 /NCGR_PEP_ID=MMETSP1075-20121228/158053_1 /TAXON_ID=2916 /ORGANISM="Ceratium fusus, Strain PA161109" /LENGTH=80 /DNA_ID=CAMNT_0013753307 /DNA_START=19 /DNA_END=257 /DNA_ORIENTATION=+
MMLSLIQHGRLLERGVAKTRLAENPCCNQKMLAPPPSPWHIHILCDPSHPLAPNGTEAARTLVRTATQHFGKRLCEDRPS